MYEAIAYLGLVDDEHIDLVAAALELSALDHHDIDVTTYVALVSRMSERVADLGRGLRSAQQQAGILAQVIAQEYGFEGDQADYNASANADMIRVFDRRRGLPASLAVLYIGIARRQDWQAGALDLPGHVLVTIGSNPPIIVDPFEQGSYVEPERIMMILAQHLGPDMPSPARFFEPITNRDILLGLLRHQALRAGEEGDSARAQDMYVRMTIIDPNHGPAWRSLALLQVENDDVEGARQSLKAMLEVSRAPQERQRINEMLKDLARR